MFLRSDSPKRTLIFFGEFRIYRVKLPKIKTVHSVNDININDFLNCTMEYEELLDLFTKPYSTEYIKDYLKLSSIK